MLPESISNQNVLFSPLNWGMGHVARSISIIQQLLEQENQVFVACDEAQKAVYEVYFSNLFFVNHAPYPFKFAGKGNWALDLFNQRKKLVARFALERKEVEKYIVDFQIGVVISDHRYGFFSNKKPSIFITHQLHLPLKWFQKSMQYIHRKMLGNFNSVWVLDDENSTLAGKLSHRIKHQSILYIGIHSRFQVFRQSPIFCDSLFIISGPMPYSQQFLDDCISKSLDLKGNNVCFYPENLVLPTVIPTNLKVFCSKDWKLVDAYFEGAQMIYSRAGYSTIMDLKVLNKKATLIATPGQAEQIYLERRLNQ